MKQEQGGDKDQGQGAEQLQTTTTTRKVINRMVCLKSQSLFSAEASSIKASLAEAPPVQASLFKLFFAVKVTQTAQPDKRTGHTQNLTIEARHGVLRSLSLSLLLPDSGRLFSLSSVYVCLSLPSPSSLPLL